MSVPPICAKYIDFDSDSDFEKGESIMLEKCNKVLKKICNECSYDDLIWFHDNWIHNITNDRISSYIEDIMDNNSIDERKFINFYINNMCCTETHIIKTYRQKSFICYCCGRDMETCYEQNEECVEYMQEWIEKILVDSENKYVDKFSFDFHALPDLSNLSKMIKVIKVSINYASIHSLLQSVWIRLMLDDLKIVLGKSDSYFLIINEEYFSLGTENMKHTKKVNIANKIKKLNFKLLTWQNVMFILKDIIDTIHYKVMYGDSIETKKCFDTWITTKFNHVE